MSDLLKGVALITGAASGIGRATAFAFAAHGVQSLALLDINLTAQENVNSELKEAHPSVETLVLHCDTSKEESIVNAIKETVKRFGRIDYAVNNAGITGPSKASPDISLDEFKGLLDVNVTGVWVGQREEIRQMLKQEPLSHAGPISRNRGVIVNLASIYGIIGPGDDIITPYIAAKHAVMGLTKSDANFYAKQNIRINAVCPGYTHTPLLGQAGGADAFTRADQLSKLPMGRLGQPEEIAEAISFLCSPMSSYVSASGLVVDG
ncbi:MAG: hypothetical protein M1827_006231 [Pycnora praestabilis]|nr:MAG: hypothetical protein M1827_006231 [Pycnora praestabilis]